MWTKQGPFRMGRQSPFNIGKQQKEDMLSPSEVLSEMPSGSQPSNNPFPHPSAMHSHFGLELGGWARKPLLPQDRTETSEKEATARPPQGSLSLCFSSFPPNLNACLCTSDFSSFLTADFLELISTKRFLWFKGGACF